MPYRPTLAADSICTRVSKRQTAGAAMVFRPLHTNGRLAVCTRESGLPCMKPGLSPHRQLLRVPECKRHIQREWLRQILLSNSEQVESLYVYNSIIFSSKNSR